MKNIFLPILFCLLTVQLFAQNDPLVKKIEVRGTAEMEVIPDEIYLRIALKEYKKGNKKISINQLEENLVKAIKAMKLPEDNLQIDNIYGYNWDWRKEKSDEFLATKSFRLKINDVKMINQLIEKLDPEGVNSINVAEVSHTKLKEYQNELKLKALMDAKEKAAYLVNGLGERLSGVLEIQELDNGGPVPMYERATMSFAKSQDSNYQSDLEFKNLIIKSEIRAVFEID